MFDKELKHMNRKELLQMLLNQAEINERLREQLDELNAELRKANEKLENNEIRINKAGSIAEASLMLSGVFEAAEEAAASYLEGIKDLEERQEEVHQQIVVEAQNKADNILNNAKAESNKIISEANTYSKKLKEEADKYWEFVNNKAKEIVKNHEMLRDFIESTRKDIQ